MTPDWQDSESTTKSFLRAWTAFDYPNDWIYRGDQPEMSEAKNMDKGMERRAREMAEVAVKFGGMNPKQVEGLALLLTQFAEREMKITRRLMDGGNPGYVLNSVQSLLDDAKRGDTDSEHDQRENWRYGHLATIAGWFGLVRSESATKVDAVDPVGETVTG